MNEMGTASTGPGNRDNASMMASYEPGKYSDDEIEMYDLDRAGYNDANYHLNQNLTTAEDTNTGRLDIVSNGVKLRTTNSGPINSGTAGQKYIVFAWGQSHVGSNNVPCTAR